MSQVEGWIAQFPGLLGLETEARKRLLDSTKVVAVAAGTVIFGPGKAPESMLLLLKGSVRVQQTSESGREIVLYRVAAGESCVMTTACLLAYEDYTAEGVAETDVEAAAIPKSTFEDLVAASATFRRFVFAAYGVRIASLFRLIDEVAFSRIDIRLAQRVLGLADASGHLSVTHHQLASELGSAREVVSRQLQEFQRRGWIATTRGSLQLLNRDALSRLAAES